MSRISGNNTKPEILVRKYLFSHGFRYRKNKKELPGKPDIVLSKYHVIIFINGCFGMGIRVEQEDYQKPIMRSGKIKYTKTSCVTKKYPRIRNKRMEGYRNMGV